jgi:hypothetical protein
MSLLWFGVLAVGATARLTRLITADHILAPARHWLVTRTRTTAQADWASTFITCTWCVSMWLAPAVIALGWWPARHGTATWWWYPAAALTVSYLVGLMSAAHRD